MTRVPKSICLFTPAIALGEVYSLSPREDFARVLLRITLSLLQDEDSSISISNNIAAPPSVSNLNDKVENEALKAFETVHSINVIDGNV